MKSISKKKDKTVEPKKKKVFKMDYKTYNPETEGYGNAEQWREKFYKRFSKEEAKNILRSTSDSPHAILGVKIGDSKETIKKAYISLIKEWHPDLNPHRLSEAEEMSKKIIAAYTLLTEK